MGAVHTTKITENMENFQHLNTREKPNDQPRASSSARPLSIQGPSSMNNSESQVSQPLLSQPRQPTNLQGLLRFAMEASNDQSTAINNQLQPMDEERREFLKHTLSSLSCNVTEELQKAIKVLTNVADLRQHDDTSEHETALESIADFVDNIDIANDFYKIGGFSIFGPCLNSSHSSIRWRAADVIAEVTQNNPFGQERFLESGLFSILLNMVDKDPAELVRIKALYAVSCIVREHPVSLKHMDVNDGYSVLLRAMQSSIKKLQVKSSFLLSSICSKDNTNNLKATLVNMGLIEQAAGLLTTGDLLPEIRDQLLNILDGLTNDDFDPALKECRRPEFRLKFTLDRCIEDLKREDNRDQIDVCHGLLKKVYPVQDINQDR